MEEQQQISTDREIARDGQRREPQLALTAAALMLAACIVALAAPQSVPAPSPGPPQSAPVPAQAPQANAPAPATQPDKPATPAPASSALLVAQVRVGDAQIAAKEYDAAIATYQSLIPQVTDPGKGELWAHIGEAYRLKRDFTNSIQAFERAYALVPNDPRIASNLGILYESQNDKIRARQYYEKAIAINPSNPLILNNLAFLLTEIGGDLDMALVYARSAQAKAPNSPEIDDTIGWIDLKKNMIPGAIAEFHKVTLLAPDNPIYHYHYAMAFKQQGNLTEAAKECQAALSHGPDKNLETTIRQDCAALLPEKK